jgi:four helix bundle protein
LGATFEAWDAFRCCEPGGDVMVRNNERSPMQRFQVLDLSHELVTAIRPLAERTRTTQPDLARQLVRATTSVPLNIAEGNGRTGRDRQQHFKIAYGSASEVSSAVEVAIRWGDLERDAKVADALGRLDQIRAILWTLTR